MDLSHCKRLDLQHTELPPCVVKYHPVNHSTLFIGTYKLEQNGIKHGTIDVYSTDNRFEVVESVKTSAVLDLNIHESGTIIVSGHALGDVILWKFDPTTNKLSLTKQTQPFGDVTITSVNFHNDQIVVTATNGQCCFVDMESFTEDHFSNSHELECWISECGQMGELNHVVFTGGDDGQLMAHDTRTSTAIWAERRHHQAGVVSILSPSSRWNATNSHQLWTGSYDDHLRILDLRVIDKANPELIEGYIPRVHQEQNTGGGVWRLIPSPLGDNRVMACCMYDGARVVEVKDQEFDIKGYFKGDHESMTYGGDWNRATGNVTTCSFYDCVVQTWDPVYSST